MAPTRRVLQCPYALPFLLLLSLIGILTIGLIPSEALPASTSHSRKVFTLNDLIKEQHVQIKNIVLGGERRSSSTKSSPPSTPSPSSFPSSPWTSSSSSSSTVLTVALISITLSRPVGYSRLDAFAKLESNDIYPEENLLNANGMTQLRCGSKTFPSYYSTEPTSSPSSFLIPLNQDTSANLYDTRNGGASGTAIGLRANLVATLFEQPAFSDTLVFALPLVETKQGAADSQGAVKTRISVLSFTLSDLAFLVADGQCALEMLSALAQARHGKVSGLPVGFYGHKVDTEDFFINGGSVVVGISSAPVSSSSSLLPPPPRPPVQSSALSCQVLTSSLARSLDWIKGEVQQRAYVKVAGAAFLSTPTNISAATATPTLTTNHERKKGKQWHEGRGDDETAFVSVDSMMQMDFTSMVGGIVKGVMKPLVDPIGNSFSLLFQMMTGDSLPGELDSGMNDLVVKELISRVERPIGETIPKQIPEIVAAELPILIADNIKDIVIAEAPKQIADDITGRLDTILSKKAPQHTNTEEVIKVAMGTAKKAAHTLGLSLAQSLTGSLLHTLTHNPLIDYYCYFCSKKQLYCVYCSTHRTQTMRNMYYAHYYASYYSYYYNAYYLRYFGDLEIFNLEHEKSYDLQILAKTTVGHGLWDTTPRLVLELTQEVPGDVGDRPYVRPQTTPADAQPNAETPQENKSDAAFQDEEAAKDATTPKLDVPPAYDPQGQERTPVGLSATLGISNEEAGTNPLGGIVDGLPGELGEMAKGLMNGGDPKEALGMVADKLPAPMGDAAHALISGDKEGAIAALGHALPAKFQGAFEAIRNGDPKGAMGQLAANIPGPFGPAAAALASGDLKGAAQHALSAGGLEVPGSISKVLDFAKDGNLKNTAARVKDAFKKGSWSTWAR